MLRFDYSGNIYMEFSMKDLANFYERSKRELEDFWALFRFEKRIPKDYENENAIKNDFMHQSFIEICFINRITPREAIKFQKILMTRVIELEMIIDRHFYTITDDVI